RDAFYETLAGLAALLARQGVIALVPATAHTQAHRRRARALAPKFLEIYVDAALETCRERDPKGLYAKAERSAIPLPGVWPPYEPPEQPDVTVRGGRDAEGAARIVELIAGMMCALP